MSAVFGGTSDRSGAIVQRLRQFGDVEPLENTECLKYLKPNECSELWRYSPHDSDRITEDGRAIGTSAR